MAFVYTTNLSQVRALARTHATMAGLPDNQVIDFVLAVSEVAANTVRHARSPGSMEIWRDADEIICEIRDSGMITDPVAAQQPRTDGTGGHGLWLVNQVCDRVELHSDETGTTVRLHMSIRPDHRGPSDPDAAGSHQM
jgi:anti-sigma regulatory factor (Ser/Thr protein kinase)